MSILNGRVILCIILVLVLVVVICGFVLNNWYLAGLAIIVTPLGVASVRLAELFDQSGLTGLRKRLLIAWGGFLIGLPAGLIVLDATYSTALMLMIWVAAWIWTVVILFRAFKYVRLYREDADDEMAEFIDTYSYDNYGRFTAQKQCSKCATMCSSFSEHCIECGESFPEYADF